MATGSAWADCRSGRGTLFRTRRGRRLAELGYAIDKRSIEHIGTRRQRMTNVLETTSFGATSTTDDVLSGVNLSGKRILVTGVSAGLGVETARSLVANGGQVVGAARDLNKAKTATEQVRKDAAANGGSFDLVELDLGNLKSVRACADSLLAKGHPFEVVIANAGVMATPFGHTADGFETQFGTNHLGHFVLVNRIASLIRDGGRLWSHQGRRSAGNIARIATWAISCRTMRRSPPSAKGCADMHSTRTMLRHSGRRAKKWSESRFSDRIWESSMRTKG